MYVCISITVSIVVIILIGILCGSFYYIEYDEYAFKKYTLSNKVYTNTVYENGRYLWGPSHNLITFPRNYQRIDFEGLSVADKNQKSLELDISIYYRVKKSELNKLYNKFGTNFESTIISKTQSIIKNTAPMYLIEEFLENREIITTVINKNVTEGLETIWIDLEDYKLQLKKITLQETTINKFLDIAVTTQQNEQAEFSKEAEEIRAETERQVQEINTNTTIITNEALAEADRIVTVAKSQADLIVSTARGEGISKIIANFSLDAVHRNKFIKYMSLIDNDNEIKLIDTDNSLIIN